MKNAPKAAEESASDADTRIRTNCKADLAAEIGEQKKRVLGRWGTLEDPKNRPVW